jgi:hypothetical protein
MPWGELLQIVVVLACLAVLAAIVYLVWRRHRLVSGRGAFDCYFRKADVPQNHRWRHGIVRYRRDAVVWFPLLAFGFKPACRIPRLRIHVGPVRMPTPSEQRQLFEGQSIVRLTPAGDDAVACEWAMAPSAANGLLAWTEAAPPGEGQYGHTQTPSGGWRP